MSKRILVDELIAERRIEELRGNVSDLLVQFLGRPESRNIAARIYVKLVERWALSTTDAARLIDISTGEYQSWLKGDAENLDVVELEKIQCLVGIYRYLTTLYSGHMDRVERWLCRKNHGDLYRGSSPYELLVGATPNVFYLVRQQLAAQTV